MITLPPWYDAVERWLEPTWPLMLIVSGILFSITFWLIYKQERVALAVWLTYLLMP